MWKNAPGPSTFEQPPPALPPILEDTLEPEEYNLPDITLEDDLAIENDIANIRGPPVAPVTPQEDNSRPDQPEFQHVNLQDTEYKSEPTYYIEDFPANFGAGATWGEDMLFFEKIWRGQESNGLPPWSPFEDEDEWELAKWLIRNVRHKQINAFLNLKIVSL